MSEWFSFNLMRNFWCGKENKREREGEGEKKGRNGARSIADSIWLIWMIRLIYHFSTFIRTEMSSYDLAIVPTQPTNTISSGSSRSSNSNIIARTQVPLMPTFLSVTKFPIVLTFHPTSSLRALSSAMPMYLLPPLLSLRTLSSGLYYTKLTSAITHIFHGTVFKLNEIN